MNGKIDKIAAYGIFPLLVIIFILTSLTSPKGSHNPTTPILIMVGLLTLIILDVITFKNKHFITGILSSMITILLLIWFAL
ncbi:hypothetical protein Q7A53_09775 [Halobacillus rhizosphaerae]|uniref:hypothetical protein n=1 Tax=Halobacillus rhizosphaerae TaxID=3064889 RepID=UPI00398AA2E2